ncbi:hypothetical protein KAR10_06365 [bacterium]|nr:hypothetical protein [bacterium]
MDYYSEDKKDCENLGHMERIKDGYGGTVVCLWPENFYIEYPFKKELEENPNKKYGSLSLTIGAHWEGYIWFDGGENSWNVQIMESDKFHCRIKERDFDVLVEFLRDKY